jgi:hypothetical protein
MINEYEVKGEWKEAAVAYFKAVAWNLLGGTEKNPQTCQSGSRARADI